MAARIGVACALLVVLVTAGALPAAAAPTEVEVLVGRQAFVTPPGPIRRIALAEPELAVTTLVGRDIRILGKRPGRTDLAVWSGRAAEPRRWTIVVSPDAEGLRTALAADTALAGVTVNTDAGGPVVLQGRVASLAAHQRLTELARAHLGDGIIDRTVVADQQTVAVDIRFAAVSVNSLKAMGFDFRLFNNGTTLATSGPSSVQSFNFDATANSTSLDIGLPVGDAFNLFLARLGSGTDVLAILGLLAKTDLAQLLAEPTLLVRSGENASFLAGGEVPIPVPQSGANGTTIAIEYKPFGVRLEIAPVVLSQDRIALTVAPEVSELDFSNGLSIQGFTVPAFRKRATSTTVELGDGQSLVLAGLMYSTTGNVDERVPGLGDLPVVGAFFKRVRAVRQQQELIIVATPRLVSPMERGVEVPLPGAELKNAPTPSLGDMLLGRNIAAESAHRLGLVE